MHQCFKAFRLLNRLPSLLFVLRQHPPRSPALVKRCRHIEFKAFAEFPSERLQGRVAPLGCPLQRVAYETECSCSLRDRGPNGRRPLKIGPVTDEGHLEPSLVGRRFVSSVLRRRGLV